MVKTQSVTFFFLSFVLYNSATPQKNGGGNFSAPMRDDSETFKNSVAGKSNWNAYEGSGEKALTPEELKAKNAKEDAEGSRAQESRRHQGERRIRQEERRLRSKPSSTRRMGFQRFFFSF